MTAYHAIRRIASPPQQEEEGTNGRLGPVVAVVHLRIA